jgi:hypothetical protein
MPVVLTAEGARYYPEHARQTGLVLRVRQTRGLGVSPGDAQVRFGAASFWVKPSMVAKWRDAPDESAEEPR